jgi:hypothetical protein
MLGCRFPCLGVEFGGRDPRRAPRHGQRHRLAANVNAWLSQFAPLSELPPEMMMFFATGVLFAASYSSTSASRELIRLAFQGQVGLVMSPDVLEEALWASIPGTDWRFL